MPWLFLAFVAFPPLVWLGARARAASLERSAVARSQRRAFELGTRHALSVHRDEAIATTWILDGRVGAIDVTVTMGSPFLGAGFVDWLRVEAQLEGRVPVGVVLRPPRRTVFEWRDGAPGEAATARTPRGRELRVDPEPALGDASLAPFLAWLDRLPHGASLVELSSTRLVLRFGAEAATSPVGALEMAIAAAEQVPTLA